MLNTQMLIDKVGLNKFLEAMPQICDWFIKVTGHDMYATSIVDEQHFFRMVTCRRLGITEVQLEAHPLKAMLVARETKALLEGLAGRVGVVFGLSREEVEKVLSVRRLTFIEI